MTFAVSTSPLSKNCPLALPHTPPALPTHTHFTCTPSPLLPYPFTLPPHLPPACTPHTHTHTHMPCHTPPAPFHPLITLCHPHLYFLSHMHKTWEEGMEDIDTMHGSFCETGLEEGGNPAMPACTPACTSPSFNPSIGKTPLLSHSHHLSSI